MKVGQDITLKLLIKSGGARATAATASLAPLQMHVPQYGNTQFISAPHVYIHQSCNIKINFEFYGYPLLLHNIQGNYLGNILAT